jgi:hypothetical protein
MPTGYEVRAYEDIHRIAAALERIADELERLGVYVAALTTTQQEGGGTHGQHQPAPEVREYGPSGPAG